MTISLDAKASLKTGTGIEALKILVQKIDILILKTHNIVLAEFLIHDSLKKVWFFEVTFPVY